THPIITVYRAAFVARTYVATTNLLRRAMSTAEVGLKLSC
ncbi:MAG: hypothetical protein ACI8RW_000046, partial [Porticoccaceae bacterium]